MSKKQIVIQAEPFDFNVEGMSIVEALGYVELFKLELIKLAKKKGDVPTDSATV